MKTWGIQDKATGLLLGCDFYPSDGTRHPTLFDTRAEALEFTSKPQERVVRVVVSVARPEQEKGR